MNFKKYKELFLYLLFGGLTTVINIVVYSALYYTEIAENVPATVIAWIASVLFAYITNRIWVFESKNKNILKEAVSFFGFRILSGIIDVAIMYIAVDMMSFDGALAKVASNVIVVILNYIFSKLWIFK